MLIADEETSALDKETTEGIHETLFSLPQAIFEASHHVKEEDLAHYDRVYQKGNKKVMSTTSSGAFIRN